MWGKNFSTNKSERKSFFFFSTTTNLQTFKCKSATMTTTLAVVGKVELGGKWNGGDRRTVKKKKKIHTYRIMMINQWKFSFSPSCTTPGSNCESVHGISGFSPGNPVGRTYGVREWWGEGLTTTIFECRYQQADASPVGIPGIQWRVVGKDKRIKKRGGDKNVLGSW